MQLLRQSIALSLGRRLPLTEGELRLPGLRAPITIRRDAYSIPYIEAENDADAWFGLGFCQAQDRALQLELRLRTLRGTLSEVFGRRTLAIDRLARRIGFHEASQRQLAVLDGDVRAHISAFVGGINAALEVTPRPHELVLLRAPASRWQPADVLGVGKLVSFLLIGNWDVELARLKILQLDGAEALRDLDPAYPEHHPVIAPPAGLAGPALDRLGADLQAFAAFAGSGGGSNAWAVAGSRSATGRPILANDPHLDPSLPAHWYLASLTTPDWQVVGAALVGGPAIGAGHNGFAAWGITAALTDTTDFFIEEVGAGGRSVRQGDGFVACAVRREVIRVRGAPDEIEDVLITPRGPLVGPALQGEAGALSLKAMWLEPRPARGFLAAHASRSFSEFRDCFRAWPLLAQNVSYADTTGKIAWQLVGELPRRRTGWGTLPAPGRDPAAGWEDEPVPFDEMPSAEDPEAGFVASANAKPVRDGEGPFLGADWLDGYRLARIDAALAGRSDWDVLSSLRLQMDESTPAWPEVREAVLALKPSTAEARQAIELLSGWDGVLSATSAAGSVFELFTAAIWRRVALARAPKAARRALGEGFTPLLPITTFAAGRASRVLRLLREQPDGWFARGWQAEMLDALTAAVDELRSEFGDSTAGWGWGAVRPLRLEHPLGVLPGLASLLNRGPFPWGGDSNTVSQAATTPLKPRANPTAIASLRMVVPVGDWEEARFSLPGGQSGNPLSPHYDDLLPLWLAGEGVPIAWSADEVAGGARSRLRLAPL